MPGVDFSQVNATGQAVLGSASLQVYDEGCTALKPDEEDTLISSSAGVSGTFAGVGNGAVVALQCFGEGTPPTVEIRYGAHSVIATVKTAGASAREVEEKREAAEVAAAKLKAEEATTRKKHEQEASAKREHEEELAQAKAEEAALAKTAAALPEFLSPSGRMARIGALLKHGGEVFSFTAALPGSLAVSWFQVPKGAHLSASHHAVLIAAGRAVFVQSGTRDIAVKLTTRGRQLLKPARQVALTSAVSFTPTGKSSIRKLKAFVLRR